VVANQDAPDGGKAIAEGNSRVLSARLADAQFFQSEDAKLKLEDYYEKLNTVVFHKKLGSIKDKAERVAVLARELAPKVGADPDKAEQAAKLAKCDLVTNMVIEFTSLEGQIGRLMYEREGGDKDIALAIEEHYKPKGPSDAVPTNPVAVAVALADKLDTLVGFWGIDEKPTGSKDPFALRRAALGVVRIILENNVRLSVNEFISIQAAELRKNLLFQLIIKKDVLSLTNLTKYEPGKLNVNMSEKEIIFPDELKCDIFSNRNKLASYFADVAYLVSLNEDILLASVSFAPFYHGEEPEELIKVQEPISEQFYATDFISGFRASNNLLTFIADRLKVYLKDKGIRHDLIDAVFALGEDDLVAIVNRVTALQSFLSTEDGENLLAGYKRAANILKAEAKKGDLPEGAPNRPADEYGAALYDGLKSSSLSIKSSLENEDFEKAMFALAELREPIDAFFTHVQVISDDTAVRENNLRLLGLIRDTARQIADFEAIQG
jgi:glycyl-tRNA synthetase beta chain